MSKQHAAYNEEVRRDFLEKNRPHNVQAKAEKAAVLAALERRSKGVKDRRGLEGSED